uniref:Uncharacterized protein n=1 Tax=Seriola lalandi dorsalis TaxID=1841481 RepID=A0A3B4Y555_SERLL
NMADSIGVGCHCIFSCDEFLHSFHMHAIARLVKWHGHEGSLGSVHAVYPECHGNHVRSICVYGAGDLKWMLKQHHLFANKFDMDTDPIAIYCLEKYLRQKALAELY